MAEFTGNASMEVDTREVYIIVSIERTGASLSLVGVSLVFLTYAISKRLRSIPNTFILFASIANVGASIACLIGYNGIRSQAGTHAFLCQAQAFLLEMFMQADPWWSLAMAVNVYMVFFMAANPGNFRRYIWVYCLICFGAPAIPALTLLFVKDDTRGPVYGDATLWCWIDSDWNNLRILTYYMPIWVCIILSAMIYVAVGYHVFHQRNQLRNLTLSAQGKEQDVSTFEDGDSAEKNLTPQNAYYGTVTTEVQITTQSSDVITPPATPCPPNAARGPSSWPTPDEHPSPGSSTRPFQTISSISSTRPAAGARGHGMRTLRDRADSAAERISARLRNLDPIKLAYLRTSFVFAISVLVTWTPSSINRVYTLVHPRENNFGLNVASAVVLPLQGVWNAVIYFTTSWPTVRDEWRALAGRRRRHHTGATRLVALRRGEDHFRGGGGGGSGGGGRGRGVLGDESEVELGPPGGTMRVVRGGSF